MLFSLFLCISCNNSFVYHYQYQFIKIILITDRTLCRIKTLACDTSLLVVQFMFTGEKADIYNGYAEQVSDQILELLIESLNDFVFLSESSARANSIRIALGRNT